MARVFIVGQGTPLPRLRLLLVPPIQVYESLAQSLARVLSFTGQPVAVNASTGASVVPPVGNEPPWTIGRVVDYCRAGGIWVDYGVWPWGESGFANFIRAARPQVGAPSGVYTIGPLITGCTAFYYRNDIQHLYNCEDPFAFLMASWNWSVNVNYPYVYGFPTSTDLDTDSFGVFTLRTPEGSAAASPTRTMHVYSSLAIAFPTGTPTPPPETLQGRPGAPLIQGLSSELGLSTGHYGGTGWYFWANPSIPVTSYASMIAVQVRAGPRRVYHGIPWNGVPLHPPLGGRVKQVVATPPAAAASCADPNKPTLREGATGSYVRLLQERLNAWGQRVRVDGTFGSDTEKAVVALQRAHANRYYGGLRVRVMVTGEVGPAMWALLCSAPGSRGSAHPPPPPSSHVSIIDTIAKELGVPPADVELMGAAAGLLLLLAIIRGR
jgi:hypothetical protein